MSPTELSKATGISVPYASQILTTDRVPSRPLAIHIFRQTGWRHPRISELSEEQLEMLERIEPWQGSEAA